MRKSNTTDRPQLIAVAATKNANGNAGQNMTYCSGIGMRYLQHFSGFVCSYN